MLLTVDDWERVCERPVPPREGRPLFAYDLGGGRAWSAGVALWRNGRVEALALAPGIPSLAEQEKRDRVPAGTYRKLAQSGALLVAESLRVQPPAALHRACTAAWGRPEVILCDHFRVNDLRDCVNGAEIVARRTRWSEAAEDIRALRQMAADGPLSCEQGSRALLTASLSGALVLNDDQGNVRLRKKGVNNEARDDVAAALVLAAGAYSRSLRTPRQRWRYAGMAA